MSYKWRSATVCMAYLAVTLIPLWGIPFVLPAMENEFGSSTATTAWVMMAYFLAMAGAFVPASHIGDMLGHKRVALLGAYLELVVMLLIIVMPSLSLIIALRFVQGLGHAMSVPNFNAFVVSEFPQEERGKVLGIMSASVGVAFLIVPFGVGAVTDALGWRWVFFIGSVLLLAVTAFGQWTLAEREPSGKKRPSIKSWDLPGAALLMVAVAPLILGLQLWRSTGELWPWALVGFALVVVVVFTRFEWNREFTTLPVRLFKTAAFAVPQVHNFIFNFTNGLISYLLPIFFITGLGWTATYAGFLVLIQNTGRPVGAMVGGYLSDRIGTRPVIAVSVPLMLFAVVGLGVTGANGDLVGLVPFMVLITFAHNTFGIANQKHMYAVVPKDQLAMAPGTMGLGRHLSQGISTGIAAGILTTMLVADAGTDLLAAAEAFRAVIYTMAGVYAAGALAAWLGPVGAQLLGRWRKEPIEQRDPAD